MKTARALVVINAAAAVALGFGLVFLWPFPLPATGAGEIRAADATIRILGIGLGGLGLAFWFVGVPSSFQDRRRLAVGLLTANAASAVTALAQQQALWKAQWGWYLVAVYAALAIGFAKLAADSRSPDGVAPDLQDRKKRGWLRQIRESAAQEERKRLARDLHDSIKQQLFSIQVSAAAAQERWDRDSDGARAALADVRRSASEAMTEMRALLHQLRPEAVATVGLVEALREQCEALGSRSGAEVKLELGLLPPDQRLRPDDQEALFRIAQEALANVARHARARKVRVWLGLEGESLLLKVEDDGRGFDPTAESRGMGFWNMKERARTAGGSLTVESAPGKGTVLTACIRLAAAAPSEEGPLQKALRRESRDWVTPITLSVLVLSIRSDQAWGFGVAILMFLLMALDSWVRVRKAAAASGPGSEDFRKLQFAAHRNRLLCLLAGFWCNRLWWQGFEKSGTGQWLWVFLAVLTAVLLVLELRHFHRYRQHSGASRTAPPAPFLEALPSVPTLVALLLGILFVLPALAGVTVAIFSSQTPAKIGLAVSGLATYGYLVWWGTPAEDEGRSSP